MSFRVFEFRSQDGGFAKSSWVNFSILDLQHPTAIATRGHYGPTNAGSSKEPTPVKKPKGEETSGDRLVCAE